MKASSGQSAYPNQLDCNLIVEAGDASSGQSAYPNQLDSHSDNLLIRQGVFRFLGLENLHKNQKRSN